MKDVMTFWMDKGVDGFRIDAVNFLFEDDRFMDEPLSGIPGVNPNSSAYLNHIYTKDQNGTLDMIYQWREHMDEYTEAHGGDARIFMTESYTDIKTTMLYYGLPDGSRLGAHFTFNFFYITNVNNNSNAQDFVDIIDTWYENMPDIYVANWVAGNHDNHRVATRLGPENVDAMNALVLLLPGVGVTYNADEIGQEDGEVAFDQCEDPPVCGDEEAFYSIGRDFERTPCQWDTTKNAGFSDADETWLPVSDKYLVTNLADQSDPEKRSHYNVYKKLVELRKSDPFAQTKKPHAEVIAEKVFAFVVSSGDDVYVALFNIGDEFEVVELEDHFDEAEEYEYINVAVSGVDSFVDAGASYSISPLFINAHDVIVGRLVKTDAL